MADDPQATVTVEIRARLDALERDLAQARTRLNAFNTAAITGGRRAAKDLEGAFDNVSHALSNVANALGVIQGPLGPLAGRFSAVSAGVMRLGIVLGGAGLALAALGKGAYEAVQAFTQLESEQAKYNAVLKATGFAAGKTAADIEELATSIRQGSTATEGAVREAAAKLLTFKAVSGDAFTQALTLSADLAAIGFGSVTSAALMMGKALEDPERGLTALRRAGVTFSQAQKNLIKDLVETGQRAKAVEEILKGVSDQVGGAAVASAATLKGAYNQLSESINNLLERWGATIVKGIGLDATVRSLAEAIDKQNKAAEYAASAIGKLEEAERRYQRTLQEGTTNSARPRNLGVARNETSIVNIRNVRATTDAMRDMADALVDAMDAAEGEEFKKFEAAAGAARAEVERVEGAVRGATNALEKEIKTLLMSDREREIDKRLREAQVPLVGAQADAIRELTNAYFTLANATQAEQKRISLLGGAATATEKLSARVAELLKEFERGELTLRDFGRALDALRLDTDAEKMQATISALGGAATATERYSARILELEKALKAETITQQVFNRAKQDAALEKELTQLQARISMLGELASVQEVVRAKELEIQRLNLAGAGITDAQTKALKEKARIQQEQSRPEVQVATERQMLFLTEQEAAIRQRLLGWGIEYNSVRGQTLAQELRVIDAIKMQQDLLLDGIKAFNAELRAGKSPLDALLSAITRMADKINDIALNNLVKGLTGGGGLFGTGDSAAQAVSQGIRDAQREAASEWARRSSGAPGAPLNLVPGATAGPNYAMAGIGAVGAGIGAYRAGEAAMSPGRGALAGALGGAMAGAALGSMVPVVGTVIGGVVGGIVGGVAGFFGGNSAQRTQRRQQREDAATRGLDYDTRAQMAGIDRSTLAGSLQAFGINAARQRADEQKLPYAQMAKLEAALAAERLAVIKQFKDQAIDVLKGEDPLSAVAQRLKDIAEASTQLSEALAAAGESTAQATTMTADAIAKLRNAFTSDLQRQFNAATGQGYLNDIGDLLKQVDQMRKDAAALGTNQDTLIDRILGARAQDIIDQAGLVGDEFRAFMDQFSELPRSLHESTAAIEENRRAEEERIRILNQAASSIVDYLSDLQTGSQSPLSPGARLASAQTTYNAQLALAQAGNIEAQQNFSRYAEDFRLAAQAMYGTGAGYQAIFNQIVAQGLALPAVQTATDSVVLAVRDAVAAINLTTTAVGSLLTSSQLAALGLSRDATTGAVISSVDQVNSVAIQQRAALDLINAQTAATQENTESQASLQATQNALIGTANSLQTTANNLSTDIKSLSATSVEQLGLLRSQLLNASVTVGTTPVQGPGGIYDSPSLRRVGLAEVSGVAVGGEPGLVNNSLLTALNKIVINTWAIAFNTAQLVEMGDAAGVAHRRGVFALGGVAAPHSLAIYGEHHPRGPFAMEVGSRPVTFSPGMPNLPSNDSSAVVAMLARMNFTMERQGRVIETLLRMVVSNEEEGNALLADIHKQGESWRGDEDKQRHRNFVRGRAA